jgi:hypothetical protein
VAFFVAISTRWIFDVDLNPEDGTVGPYPLLSKGTRLDLHNSAGPIARLSRANISYLRLPWLRSEGRARILYRTIPGLPPPFDGVIRIEGKMLHPLPRPPTTDLNRS